MTQNISLMTEEELIKLRDYLTMTKKSLSTKKEKIITLVASLSGVIVVGVGVGVAVLFPNPITLAALGGLAVLSSKTMGPRKSLKKIKEKTKQKEVVKSDLDIVKTRLNEIKIEKKVRNSMQPSLKPILYPSLNPDYEK